jgi:hypothetical protein
LEYFITYYDTIFHACELCACVGAPRTACPQPCGKRSDDRKRSASPLPDLRAPKKQRLGDDADEYSTEATSASVFGDFGEFLRAAVATSAAAEANDTSAAADASVPPSEEYMTALFGARGPGALALEQQVRAGTLDRAAARAQYRPRCPERRFRPGYNSQQWPAIKAALEQPVDLPRILQPIWSALGSSSSHRCGATTPLECAIDAVLVLSAVVPSVQRWLLRAPDSLGAATLDPLQVLFALVKTRARLSSDAVSDTVRHYCMQAAYAAATSFCAAYHSDDSTAEDTIEHWLEPLDAVTLPKTQRAWFQCECRHQQCLLQLEAAHDAVTCNDADESLAAFLTGLETELEDDGEALHCLSCGNASPALSRRFYEPLRELLCVQPSAARRQERLPPTLTLTQWDAECRDQPALVYRFLHAIYHHMHTGALRGISFTVPAEEEDTEHWRVVRAWYALDSCFVTQLLLPAEVHVREEEDEEEEEEEESSVSETL